MNTTIAVNLKLEWSGKAMLDTGLISEAERDLLMIGPVQTADNLRFKYKKQVAENICDGYLEGTLYVGENENEVEWEWEPNCEIDGDPIDISDVIDYIDMETMAEQMLDGAENGEICVPVEIAITLAVTATSGRLAMGEITVESMDILDVYVNCNFATDGNDVVFDEELELPGEALKALKLAVIGMVNKWK